MRMISEQFYKGSGLYDIFAVCSGVGRCFWFVAFGELGVLLTVCPKSKLFRSDEWLGSFDICVVKRFGCC